MAGPIKIANGALSWRPTVPTPGDLPVTGGAGDVIEVQNDGDGKTALYAWNHLTLAWEKVADPDGIIPSGAAGAKRHDLSSQANGVKVQFDLVPAASSIDTMLVSLRGLVLRPGAGGDFTIDSVSSITFNSAPELGDTLLAYYAE